MCIYPTPAIHLLVAIKVGFSKDFKGVFAAKPDNWCWISIPCGEGESRWPLVFRDLPSCRFLLCPASMPQAQCLLLLSSVQIFYLYFPSLVPLFSITFLHPLLASIGPSSLPRPAGRPWRPGPCYCIHCSFYERVHVYIGEVEFGPPDMYLITAQIGK